MTEAMSSTGLWRGGGVGGKKRMWLPACRAGGSCGDMRPPGAKQTADLPRELFWAAGAGGVLGSARFGLVRLGGTVRELLP